VFIITALALISKIFLIFLIIFNLLIGQTKRERSKKNFSKQSKNIHTLVIIFLFVNIVSGIRGFDNGLFHLSQLILAITDLIFFYLVGRFAVVLEKKDKIISSLYSGILFYVIVELFLLYFRVSLPGFLQSTISSDGTIGSDNSLSSLFGFQSDRILFPLASFSWGATHLGSIVGVIFVSSCIHLMYTDLVNNGKSFKSRFRNFFRLAVHCVSIVASFWVIVLADSRAAAFGAFLSVLIFLIIRLSFTLFGLSLSKKLLKLLNYIPQFIISFYLFSFLFMFVKEFLGHILEITNLYRGNTEDAFTYRDIIWQAVIDFLAEFSPFHIIGYGIWGQYVAGIDKVYQSILFGGSDNKHTLHSTILQNLIDTGYLGIFVYISLTLLVLVSSKTIFLKTMYHKLDCPRRDFSIFSSVSNLSVLFYLIMVGASDSVITMERIFSTNIYMVLVMSSLTLVPNYQITKLPNYQITKLPNYQITKLPSKKE
jgi:hypothetical protein